MESVGKRMWELGFQNQALNSGNFLTVVFGSLKSQLTNGPIYYDLYHLYSGNQDVVNLVLFGSEPEKSPFSHLKHMWSISKRNHSHSFQMALTTQARGKVQDVLDIWT